jgi:hypothetical protein
VNITQHSNYERIADDEEMVDYKKYSLDKERAKMDKIDKIFDDKTSKLAEAMCFKVLQKNSDNSVEGGSDILEQYAIMGVEATSEGVVISDTYGSN